MSEQFGILAFKVLQPSKQPSILPSQGFILQTEHIQLRRLRDNLVNWLIFSSFGPDALRRTGRDAHDFKHARR